MFREDVAFQTLSILLERYKPTGSGKLHQMLAAKGVELSEATIGRLLAEMDRLKLTKKVSRKGRVITDRGKEKLREISGRLKSYRLIETLQDMKLDLSDVLESANKNETDRVTGLKSELLDAVVAKNIILAAALNLIRKEEPLSPIYGYTREKVVVSQLQKRSEFTVTPKEKNLTNRTSSMMSICDRK